MRKTKIICTVGPESESKEMLRELMLAGMNVARFNFSHGDHEEQKNKFIRLAEVREELGLPVATLLDTKGPEIRLQDFDGKKVFLEAGQTFSLMMYEVLGNTERASVTYTNLINDVSVGSKILIDDGLIGMEVIELKENEIVCRVNNSGPVSNHKGVNVPGVELTMPYISEKDRSDILFGIEMGFDFVAVSFARTKEDVLEVKAILDEHNSPMKIIAKIENMQGIQNLEEIISVSDGIMVARGDLGVEIPLEEIPVWQKRLIKLANAKGKHVITATQMLDSMMKNPRPTRAETTDVANAIYDGTTAIMLSGETANGMYPVEALKTMAKIAENTEKDIDYHGRMARLTVSDKNDITTAIAFATCSTAMDLNAAAIITVTMSGYTAAAIARFKPGCPIIGCSMDEKVCRQLNLIWGVNPLALKKEEDTEELFADAVLEAKNAGYVKTGDRVVITAGVPLGITGRTNMIRVVEVE
ncbi:MAG: pyruvate kinase [Lachnospiraceae bacterium]|nr:pyruvate kinase [Lachnospiraceae bacterium]